MTKRLLRLIPVLILMFLLTACFDEIAELFEIVVYEESDDPEIRQTGKAMREIREEREAREAVDQFLETGDRRHLDAARSIRPDDTSIRGYDVVVATLDGDPAAIEAAQEALTLAEARRLASLSRPGDPPATAEHLRRNVLGEILVAQTKMLGGSLTNEWDPPGSDAPPEARRLYSDYCATRNVIQTEFNDPLTYLPLPPCPAN